MIVILFCFGACLFQCIKSCFCKKKNNKVNDKCEIGDNQPVGVDIDTKMILKNYKTKNPKAKKSKPKRLKTSTIQMKKGDEKNESSNRNFNSEEGKLAENHGIFINQWGDDNNDIGNIESKVVNNY